LVREAIVNGVINELQGYETIRGEVRYGEESSRIDLLLQGHPEQPDCYLEVKNVTLDEQGQGMFPDAVTQRGTRHLRELMAMVDQGFRATLLFCVQHDAINSVTPADEIDPLYGQTLRQAVAHGVEVLAYKARLSPEEVVLVQPLAVVI
jgi:sugar fermentation stimulation protein A